MPESDESLLDLPLRDFFTSAQLAEFLGITTHSAINALDSPILRKIKLGPKCWLITKASAASYKDQRASGGRPRTRSRRRRKA